MNGSLGLRLEQYSGSGGGRTDESAYPAASGRGPRRGRILIMDDDRLVRETMRRQLAICGYEVVTSVDGQEAVQAYLDARTAGRPFDAVILDLMVGTGWGGEQTLQALLKVDPAVKALVCSGTLAASETEYMQKGFRAVIGKPYTLGELRVKVEAAIPPQGKP